MNSAALHNTTATLRHRTDSQVITATSEWTQNERFSTSMLITHLAEMATRKLYLDRAPSLFSYCTDILKLEPGCVWLRLQVANCCRKFPELLDEIVAGNIGLSVAALLAPHLTAENKAQLISAARNKVKRVVEELLADLNPTPATTPGIRAHSCVHVDHAGLSFEASSSSTTVQHEKPVHTTTPPAELRSKIIPLGNLRYDLKFSFDAAQKAKLERFGELIGIAVHGPQLAALVERALDIALKAKDPAQKKPRRPATTQAQENKDNFSRYISTALKKDLLERAQYRCQHSSGDGVRCTQRSKLEIDHKTPLAWGGATCSDNLQVLCSSHHRMKTHAQQGPWVVQK